MKIKSKEQILLEQAYNEVRAQADPEIGLLVDFISEGDAPGSLEEGICCLIPKKKFKSYVKMTEELDPDSIESLETKDGFIVYEELRYCVWKKAFTKDYSKLLQSVLSTAGLLDARGETSMDAEDVQSVGIDKEQQAEFNRAVSSGKWCKFKFKTTNVDLSSAEEEDEEEFPEFVYNAKPFAAAAEDVVSTFGRVNQSEHNFDSFEPPAGIPLEGKMFTN